MTPFRLFLLIGHVLGILAFFGIRYADVSRWINALKGKVLP